MAENRIGLTRGYSTEDMISVEFVFDVVVIIRRHNPIDKVRGDISVIGRLKRLF